MEEEALWKGREASGWAGGSLCGVKRHGFKSFSGHMFRPVCLGDVYKGGGEVWMTWARTPGTQLPPFSLASKQQTTLVVSLAEMEPASIKAAGLPPETRHTGAAQPALVHLLPTSRIYFHPMFCCASHSLYWNEWKPHAARKAEKQCKYI